MITVDIWSDVACPFCYIGKRNFEQAVQRSGLKEQIRWEWRSFQLDPQAPKEDDRSIYKILAEKYGQSEDKARKMTANVISMGAQSGLDLNMDVLQPTNTFDAHRLIHFAKEHDLQNEMKERLFKAYFVEGVHLGRSENLIRLAEETGLDKGEAFKILDGGSHTKEVQEDMETARTMGIQGVPFFLFNKKYGVSGAQPVAGFINVFEQIIQKEKAEVSE